MKTIKQIADEIGVSKQAVQKRIAREPLCTSIQAYISTHEGIKYIDEAGENLIKSAFTKIQPTTTYTDISIDIPDNQQPTVHSAVHTDIHSEILKTLQENLLILQEQLKVKDKQIEDLENDKRELHEEMKVEREHSWQQADKLAELTRNSQILLKQEQDKNALLLVEQSPTASSEPDESDMKSKRPFWQFWKK